MPPIKAKRSPKPSAVAVGSAFVSMGNTKSSPTRSIQRSPHKKSDVYDDLSFKSSHEEESILIDINDTKLVGTHQLITLDTAQYAIHLVLEYHFETNPSKTFRKNLFDPLWQRLKEQGCNDTLTKKHIKAKKRRYGNKGTTKLSSISWRSERNIDKLSIYNWVYVPPTSKFGQDKKGMYVPGVDYYNTEERLVRDVLQEISTLDELSDLYAANIDYFSSIMPILDRAVSQGIDYKNAAALVLEDGDKKMSAKPSKRNRDDEKIGVSEPAGKKKKGEKKSASLNIKQEDVVLPSPKHGQYYTKSKSEAISVITQYPKGSAERALAIEGMQVKGYVPIGKSGMYKLLRKDEHDIPIDDTDWEVEVPEECAEEATWEQNFNDLIQYKKKYG